MCINKQNAEEWIGKFLEGETDNEEEQALYKFFCSDNIPRRLKKYKPMFDWYANGMQESYLPPRRIFWKRGFISRISVAASLVLACGVGMGFYRHYQKMQVEYECYEGSYIIRNGEKISDVKQILPELQKTTRMAQQEEREINRTLKMTPDEYVKGLKSDCAKQKGQQEELPVI
jgi:hypothetical protein